MNDRYLQPSRRTIAKFLSQDVDGRFTMLHLLRFRDSADYSSAPERAPAKKLTGAQAYQHYLKHLIPHLKENGDEVIFIGSAAGFLTGPKEERWDMVIMIRHRSLDSFSQIAANQAFREGLIHRTAALEDCRMLPIDELDASSFT